MEEDDVEGEDSNVHVHHGEDAAKSGFRAEVGVGEVIDGGDEGVPKNKVTEAEGEVGNVG